MAGTRQKKNAGENICQKHGSWLFSQMVGLRGKDAAESYIQ